MNFCSILLPFYTWLKRVQKLFYPNQIIPCTKARPWWMGSETRRTLLALSRSFSMTGVDWMKLADLKLTGAKNFDGVCFSALMKTAPNLNALVLDG